ncbi:hypothetical protein ND748_00895 [Frankia sp. AiPs1]|uniref:hypothetical protein n=1 Tax=Frankia sp. AiPs1 TaxID=573493 RepID=UPI002042C343|nr:hypothetical protein [Frankia sp. AiPs1]MCM3920246.1 hypothetical protein [Frankia sp. AiPs1]
MTTCSTPGEATAPSPPPDTTRPGTTKLDTTRPGTTERSTTERSTAQLGPAGPSAAGPSANAGPAAEVDAIVAVVREVAAGLGRTESAAADAVRAELARSSCGLHDRASRDCERDTAENVALLRAWARALARLSSLAPPGAPPTRPDPAPPSRDDLLPAGRDDLPAAPESTPNRGSERTAAAGGIVTTDPVATSRTESQGGRDADLRGGQDADLHRSLLATARSFAASAPARPFRLAVPADLDAVRLWQWIHLAVLRLPDPDAARRQIHRELGVELPAAPNGQAVLLPDLPWTGQGGVPLGHVRPDVAKALGPKAPRFGPAAVVVSDILQLVGLAEVDRALQCGLWRIVSASSHRSLAAPALREKYRTVTLERLAALAAAPEGSEQEAHEMWRVHEAVASVYPWPLPAQSGSWWATAVGRMCDVLAGTVAEVPRERRPTIEHIIPGSERYAAITRRQEDIAIDDPPAGRALRELRAYYTWQDDHGDHEEFGRCVRTVGQL